MVPAFLLMLALMVGGCGDDEEAAPASPKTSISLTGIAGPLTETQTTGVRFGPEIDPVTELPTGTLANYGVTVSMSSNPSGTTYWRSDATDCTLDTYSSYSASTNFPIYTPADDLTTETWQLCYYSVANGLTGSTYTRTVVFDRDIPTPTFVDTNGDDPTDGVTYYESFPSFKVGFDTSANYYTGEDGIIYYTTDGSTPSTSSSKINVTNAVGSGSFLFSGGATREVKLLVVDDVGNTGSVQTYQIQMEMMSTNPSAGFYNVAQSVQLSPSTIDAFITPGFTDSYIHLCRHTLAGGYECTTDLTTYSGPATQTAADTLDYAYTYNGNPLLNEVISLPGSAGFTTVYDLKILNDSYNGDGGTDVDHQALFVVDLDYPTALIFPDPDRTTDDSMRVQATSFDAGYFTVLDAGITNYAVTRDLSAVCVTTLSECLEPIASTMSVPSSATDRPSSNQAIEIPVTVTDGAGNIAGISKYIPIGRTLTGGSGSSDSANLGHAMATGDFNTTSSDSVLNSLKPPDYIISEPSAGAGKVYLFYETLRSAIEMTGSTFSSLDLTTDNTVTLTVTVDGADIGGGAQTITILSTNEYISSISAVTPSELAHAFNQEVLLLSANGTDLDVYMTAESGAYPTSPTHVVLRSNTGEIDTCITVSTTNLQTSLGLDDSGQICVYDAKITGETSGDLFGQALATGDFDGDGYDDLAVGAPNGNTGTGRVYVFHSGQTTPAFPTGAATADTLIDGATSGDDFGWSLAAGDLDINANSVDDLLVGAPGVTVGGDTDAGRVYLFRGPVLTVGTIADTAADWTADNPVTITSTDFPRLSERYGHSLLIGQMNTSTTPDEFAVGAPGGETLAEATFTGKGAVYFYDVDTGDNSITKIKADGFEAGSMFGWSLGMAGDVIQDLCTSPCIAIGAPHENNTQPNTGVVYIGKISDHDFGSGQLIVKGTIAGLELGTAFASGDMDDDGIPELVVGQGGALVPLAPLTANFGGINIIQGAATTPGTIFLNTYELIDVDPFSGLELESRFGGSLLLVKTDPSDTSSSAVNLMVIGAPGGLNRSGNSAFNEIGRVHLFGPSTFQVP